jgi:pimeloyl-ACP methyl ester carboxylesterase
VRWHRAGFRGYWRWKSRSRGGRILKSGKTAPLFPKTRPTTRRSRVKELTMPILALGAENSFGEQQAAIMREVGTNVEGGIIANSGHWIMEEQPDATVKAVRAFLDKK